MTEREVIDDPHYSTPLYHKAEAATSSLSPLKPSGTGQSATLGRGLTAHM